MARFRADLSALFATDRDRLLVAVSGGGDSVALLLLAHAVLGDRCVAATVDHGLRPESAEEAAFVARLCDGRRIAHRTLTGLLPPRIGRTANLSARARALRYSVLEDARVAAGAAAIATAHHADDQVETLIMRLNRGGGVSGLAGVRAREGALIRPLLSWRRAELAALVGSCAIQPVNDPSNTDDRFDRARVRKALAGAEWLDADGWRRSAAAMADAEQALIYATDRLWRECGSTNAGGVELNPMDLPFEFQRRLTMRALNHVDPALQPRGSDVARMVTALSRGESAMLGNVRAVPADGGRWHFSPAPPRRSH